MYWSNHKTYTRDSHAGLSCVQFWNFPHVKLFSITFFLLVVSFVRPRTGWCPLHCYSWDLGSIQSTLLPIAIFSYVLPRIEYNSVSSRTAQRSLFLRVYLLIFRFSLMPNMLLWFIRPRITPPPLRTQSLWHLKYLWHPKR